MITYDLMISVKERKCDNDVYMIHVPQETYDRLQEIVKLIHMKERDKAHELLKALLKGFTKYNTDVNLPLRCTIYGDWELYFFDFS